MPINDFIQFHFGWLNAWIPSFALVLIQLLYMILYREGGKRAVDTSWYTSKDKRYATLSFVFQGTLLLVSLFVPLRIGTPLFTVGCVLFAFALVGFMAAFHAYASTPKGETVVRGVYRLSLFTQDNAMRDEDQRNCGKQQPQRCRGNANRQCSHFIEEVHRIARHCMTTYGEDYARYKARTPRYFLLK